MLVAVVKFEGEPFQVFFILREVGFHQRKQACGKFPPGRAAQVLLRAGEQVFCIRRSTASRFLIALEKEEMIERVSAPNDARRKIIVPTEKALAIHAQFIAQRDALEAQITRGIPREEVDAFLATAKRIQANLAELPQQKE